MKGKYRKLVLESQSFKEKLSHCEKSLSEKQSESNNLRKSYIALERDLEKTRTDHAGEVEKLGLQIKQLVRELDQQRTLNKSQQTASAHAYERKLQSQVSALEKQVETVERERDELKGELCKRVEEAERISTTIAAMEDEKKTIQVIRSMFIPQTMLQVICSQTNTFSEFPLSISY